MIRRAGYLLLLLALAAAALAAGAAILLAPQPSPPPPPATEHLREPAGASPPATPTSTPSSAPRVDQLARPLTDAEAQQLLEEVTPGALDERHAAPAIAQAWAVLSDDMQRGGWSQPRRRAAVVVPVTVDTTGRAGRSTSSSCGPPSPQRDTSTTRDAARFVLPARTAAGRCSLG